MCGIFRYFTLKPLLNNFNGQRTVVIVVNNAKIKKKKINKIIIRQNSYYPDIYFLILEKRYIVLQDELSQIIKKLRMNDPKVKLNLIFIAVSDSTNFTLFLQFVDVFQKYNGDNKKLYFISYIVDPPPQLRLDQNVIRILNLLKELNPLYLENISYARCLILSENTVAISNQLNCALTKFYNTKILFFDELIKEKLVEITFELNSHHVITR